MIKKNQFTAEPDGAVKSMTRALELLTCFSPEQPEWGVTEIAEYLGMYKSTAHRFLVTFEQAGFVERTEDRRYRLGLRALELGVMFRFNSLLIRTAEQPLRILAERTGSIAHLTQLDKRETIELLRKSGLSRMTFVSHPVLRRQAHATSTGKILLAHGSDENFQHFLGRRQVLNQYTPYTITSPDKLRSHAHEIVNAGYAVDDQESLIGVRCLGVPVRDSLGKVVAAISITNSVEKFKERNIFDFLPHLSYTARMISRDLKPHSEYLTA